MKAILARHMPTAQFVFDAICSSIFLVSMIVLYCMLSGGR